MRRQIPILIACAAATLVLAQVVIEEVGTEDSDVVRASDVSWGALNPARGNKGPRAGTLWNDRTGESASGFLVRFSDGFSSPPHIHNVTYRGVVISGEIHNDDPAAAEMWMPAGSFWTQPAGEVHITAAKGENAMAYIEIDSGPYLVLPREEAFDKGERPVNVVPSNLVWLSSSQTNWIVSSPEDPRGATPEIAFLWGEPGSDTKSGSFLKVPKGFGGELLSESGPLRVVIVEGRLKYSQAGGGAPIVLTPGEYFGVEAKEGILITTEADEPCVAYIQGAGSYVLKGQP